MPHGPPHAQDILVIPRTGVAGVSLSEFCNWLDRSLRAENTVITSMVRYTGEGSVRHRFLVLDARNGSGEFCIRLDRHPSSRNILSLSSGPLQGAKDMVRYATHRCAPHVRPNAFPSSRQSWGQRKGIFLVKTQRRKPKSSFPSLFLLNVLQGRST